MGSIKQTEIRDCQCGRGDTFVCDVSSSKRFNIGHNFRVLSDECIRKRTEKAMCSVKRFYGLNPDKLVSKGKKISKTKLSVDGNKRLRVALDGCRDRMGRKGRKPSNYIPEDEKPRVHCLFCNKEIIVTPNLVGYRKFCNRDCQTKYKTGRPMLNWNPNSFHDKTGRGICGRYKGVLFRSSYELSFIVEMLRLGLAVVAEPVRIKMSDFISSVEKEVYKIRTNQYYTPDYLIKESNTIIEIKPDYLIFGDPEELCYQSLLKVGVLEKFCRKNGYKYDIFTEEVMKEYMLSYSQIRNISKTDIVFFKQKHIEQFQ